MSFEFKIVFLLPFLSIEYQTEKTTVLLLFSLAES